MLFTVSSVSVSAESSTDKQLKIYQYYRVKSPYSSTNIGNFTFYPNNSNEEKKEDYFLGLLSGEIPTLTISSIYNIAFTDNSVIFEQDKNYNVTLQNYYFSSFFQSATGADNGFYCRKVVPSYVQLLYSDGTNEVVKDVTLDQVGNNPYFNIKFSATPKKDIYKIQLAVDCKIGECIPTNADLSYPTYELTVYSGEFNGDDKYQFTLEAESQEAGLLKGVIEWLKGIKNGITDLFDGITEGFKNLGQGITNLFNSILELPSKLWELISNGLKSLFVPSEDFIVQFKNDIDSMLENKLGAVYQVVNILLESWDRITANDIENTITIPETTINLPNNNQFSFGGVNVLIVPNGFDWLANTIKTLVGIVCTVLFVNGLRKKYDEVMGVEQ